MDRQQESAAYLRSEDYKRDLWEATEDSFEKKFKAMGKPYTRRPYISDAQKREEAEAARKERISSLKAELVDLLNEEEKSELIARLKANDVQ